MRTSGGPRPFVCFCGQDWWYHNRAHSDFQLMTRVAKSRPVLLINSIGMRMPLPGRSTKVLGRITRKAKSVLKCLRRPVPDLPLYHVMTPLMIPFYGTPWARRLSAGLVRRQVQLAARWVGIRDPIIFVTVPTAWEVASRMQRAALVYNRSDKHSAFAESDRDYIASLEEKLLRGSDLVLYVNGSLMEEERALTGERARFLDHGVDLEHFRPRPPEEEPADLRAIPRPRIGFFGSLREQTVDFALLERVAREVPEASLVLVGSATARMDRLVSLPNVRWLGFRPYSEIPKYGSGFDVALMPWLRNEWIRFCNPIKMKEYLALGANVVSTDFPEVHRYAEVVSIAASPEDFVARVRRALLEDPGRERRIAAVTDQTWDRRTAELLELCDAAAAKAQGTIPVARRPAGPIECSPSRAGETTRSGPREV